jgi:hypothetical protein
VGVCDLNSFKAEARGVGSKLGVLLRVIAGLILGLSEMKVNRIQIIASFHFLMQELVHVFHL